MQRSPCKRGRAFDRRQPTGPILCLVSTRRPHLADPKDRRSDPPPASGALVAQAPALTVMLGALIAVAPLAMDIYLASMPSMTRALGATTEQVALTLSVYM